MKTGSYFRPPIGSQEEDSQRKPPAPIPAGIRPVANPTITTYQDPKEPTAEAPKRCTRSENGKIPEKHLQGFKITPSLCMNKVFL
jgi:hypothetical protein